MRPQTAFLLDHGREQFVGMNGALHHRAGLAGEHHGDGACRRRRDDRSQARSCQCRDIGAQFFGRLGDPRGIADQNRPDQAFSRRQHRAAERILILRADHDGLQRRQLRGKRDQMREMILLIDDQRRQFARSGLDIARGASTTATPLQTRSPSESTMMVSKTATARRAFRGRSR